MSKNALIAVITVSVCFFGTVTIVHIINKDKPHVPSTREAFSKKCAEGGGSPETITGWQNKLYTEKFKCHD